MTEGVAHGKEQFRAALQAIVAHYETAAERAATDVARIAHQIVENLIGSYLEEHPDRLREWILQAVENLKQSRGLTLTYNPRYHESLSRCAHEFSGIMHVVSDPSLGDADFKLKTTTGGVSFSWRETLRPLAEPQLHTTR
jgi:flagellar biosynthesis/type III secretory pathway protein FliH